MSKVIINLCPTGMVPTKAQNQYVPTTPKEIIDTALDCAKLGASVIHVHARDKQGKPTWKKEEFAKIIAGIRAANKDLIITVTTSGRNWSDLKKRADCLELKGDLKPDMASLTVGSMNFINDASINSPKAIEQLATMMQERGIKTEFEVFEPGMIHKANFMLEKGIIKDNNPYFNFLFGSLGTSPLHPASFAALHALLPKNAIWSTTGIGQYQLDANVISLAYGGHIRVGLEDNLFFDRNKKEIASNQILVERIANMIKLLGLEIATPKETRVMLGL